jgi:hypothetical protein
MEGAFCPNCDFGGGFGGTIPPQIAATTVFAPSTTTAPNKDTQEKPPQPAIRSEFPETWLWVDESTE